MSLRRGGRLRHVARILLQFGGTAILAAGVWSVPARNSKTTLAKKIDYNRDVRPIITKCFTCHGHDSKAVMANLRLDQKDTATEKLPDGVYAVVPFHPEKSEMVTRIFATNALQMPPASSNKVLNADEKRILKEWIAEGAEYKKHWAFVAPIRPAVPQVKNPSWVRNPIDAFVLAKMEEKGLKPAPEADRRTLIRRLSLDLDGIPATPKDVKAFLADKSPKAYEKVVDRLLASPRYGERMAMDWMDYARYADSNGYQADFERFQWRWRDWVIDAYNKNMPYDEFTVEQLAGDLLPHPTLDQIVATGFNRNHRINTEGGVIPEEWRIETVIDRVETTSATWLGLTAGCARCHDHKYDPISQKDFYSLNAFFNNVPESGSGVERPENHPPYIKAPYPSQAKQLAELTAKLTEYQKQASQRLAVNAVQSAAWNPTLKDDDPKLEPGRVARYTLGSWPAVASGSVPTPVVKGKVKGELGRSTGSVVTGDMGYLDLGQKDGFDGSSGMSYGCWIKPNGDSGSPVAKMDTMHDYRGWDMMLDGGRPSAHFLNKWPDNALKVISKTKIPMGQWSHVLVTYDGTQKPDGVQIYINGKPTEKIVDKDSLSATIKSDVPITVGRRTTGETFDGEVDDLVLYNRVLSGDEAAKLADVSPAAPILRTPVEKRTTAQIAALNEIWSSENDAEYRKVVNAIKATTDERDKLDSEITTVMVMKEMPKPRDCFVLIRGQYDHHGPRVTAATPAFLPPIPAGYPRNRLGLAKWIVSPSNPLTARVTVNRFWERFFGTGIVATSEDFGTRAEFPSHPELLDWLATEIVRLKWDQKAIIKELVMSATYRQSSDASPDDVRIDPTNRFLAHGPRFRFSAEVIRDQALAIAGLLVEKVGGPSVRPYQPDGVWDELNVYGNLRNYKHDTDSGLHRRSLYTIWKRTAAPPEMTLFDMSTRETCRVKRARTNTPLQALVLLNDVTFVESARILANRMITEGGPSVKGRLDYAYERALSRPPTSSELRILESGLARRLAHYRQNPMAAKKLIAMGDAKNSPGVDSSELAAYTVVASTILNLDETVTKE
ncbi:MAG: DUF1553 domain-containing protein [Fimbriimonas sp.]|nr:DUF1553 domain-containing protein [Fimbriimonas sp.]